MKKYQREIYQTLANEIDWGLCAFCKYSQADGYSGCDCGEPYCTHPLLDKSLDFKEQEKKAARLGDCWGFRPRHSVDFCVDIVGITLDKGWDEATWWQNKKGQWKITGQRVNYEEVSNKEEGL